METYSNLYLSKRASMLDSLKEEIVKLWKPGSPLASIFSLLSYAIPFIPGLGWGAFAIEKIASFLGLGLEDLGAMLDSKCHLNSSSGVEDIISCVGKSLTSLVQDKKASMSSDEIIKQAFWGALLTRLIPIALRVLGKVIATLFLAVGARNLGDMDDLVSKAKGMITEKVKENITPEMVSQYMTPDMLMGLLSQQE